MATVITEECINCGACEPECPNTAIYQGGVAWDLDGATHPAISDDIFYIVPQKCTECVGFYDHEACAAVCPVDCCVPDPKIPETEEQLIARARQLHPDVTFPPDFPSRFRKEASAGSAPAESAPAGNGHAADSQPGGEPAAAVSAPPAAVSAPSPRATAKPAAPGAPSAGVTGGRVEKPVRPPAAPPKPKQFAGELSEDFEEILHRLYGGQDRGRSTLTRVLAALAMPLLGALPHGTKKRLEEAAGGSAVFSAVGATALNAVLNFFLYAGVFAALGAVVFGRGVFTLSLDTFIFYGVSLAATETAWRFRDSLFRGLPPEEVTSGAALYGPLLVPLVAPVVRLLATRVRTSGTVAFDGFYDSQFDEKRDRQRRYGEVYRLEDLGNGYLLRFEFPHRIPASSVKEELRIPDDMPDYDYEIALSNGSLVVRGKVSDPLVRKIASGAPSFPPDFTTRIDLGAPVRGFKHRYRDKTLEVILVKQG